MASTWDEYKNARPQDIVDDIVAHEDSDIIKTKLDQVTKTQGAFHNANYPGLKIASTLDQVREHIAPYLQWVAYLALAWATSLIIYNGLRLVLSPLSPDEAAKVKSRMTYIVLGVLLVTGFYFILKIILAIYYDIFVR